MHHVLFQHLYFLLGFGLRLIPALKGRDAKDTRQQRESILFGKLEGKTAVLCMMTPTCFSSCYFFYVEHLNPHDCLWGQGQGFHSQNIHFLSHIGFHFHKFQYICRGAKCVNEREREKEIFSRDKFNFSMA